MNALSVGLFLLCGGLGWYGAVKALRLGMRGEDGAFIFRPLGAGLYVFAGLCALVLFLLAEKVELGGTRAELGLPLIVPVLVLPYGAYLAALMVVLGKGFFSPLGSMGGVRSYDKGDAAMAKRRYAEAAACYRADLVRWPGDTQALLRLARALEAAGQHRAAAAELEAARRALLSEKPPRQDTAGEPALALPENKRRDRHERTLQITFALGELYTDLQGRPEKARALYEETLELMYGYPGVDALRERLKLLATGAGADRAAEKASAAPDKIPLE